ncbi:conjugative transposon protein TraM [Larkinella humicola]|uniref:Conjugative transposon protein TraM n=1 Tax=Larkinella humicola TaxID=2607654 RepID=A0A5N1J3R7_9BACT|nr:conjugative transposon protein TraM [Larkinella humicola]KAA9341176.1 conjugative transposon protein TraM [Larkinella humicola]
MNTTATLMPNSDEAFYHNRKAYLVFPLIVFPFLAALFYVGGGGKGIPKERQGQTAQSVGFNAKIPTAENSELKRPSIGHSVIGSAEGQTLSEFSNTQKVTVTNSLREIPTDEIPSEKINTTQAANGLSNLHAESTVPSVEPQYASRTPKARNGRKSARQQGFQYHPAQPYYVGTNQTDQQLESQLSTYQTKRSAGQPTSQPTFGAAPTASDQQSVPSMIELADNNKATRLADYSPVVENPFNTAEVGAGRREAQKTTLQSSGYTKRAVATMIPAVIHDDQSVRPGQPVKLRLTIAIVVDGINVPANTIVHAICKPEGDRIFLVVRSLQLNSQLIPLDLEAVDLDGGTGVNAPGLSEQLGGQLKSSAVQGVQVPTGSALINTVLSTARFGASSAVRQSTIHLKGGYHLYLKSI